MNPDDVGNFLSRWSRRKLEKTVPRAAPQSESQLGTQPESQPALQVPAQPAAEAPPPEPLPPVESLTADSDYKPFMLPEVDPGVKRAALKQLFKDPQFNVMDGLDTYIDDFSIEDPIPEAMMKTLYQAREHLFSPEEKAAAIAEDKAAEDKAARDTAAEEKAAEPQAPDTKDA